MKLSQICEILEVDFSLVGGEDFEISALNSLGRAGESELSYCDSEKNAHFIEASKAGAILVTKPLAHLVKTRALIVPNPHLAFAILSKFYAKPLFATNPTPPQIHPTASVSPRANLGSGVVVGENSVVMAGVFLGDNVVVGKECIIHPNVVLYNDVKVGDRCVLNANCVVGSDGFGFAHTADGRHIKIHHNGWVELEDDVEIGACTTIDRGVFEPTIIRAFSKIDNLVQVGHNCEVGFGCLIVSQVGLSGSSKLGRNVVMGGQSATAGHLTIGDFAQIGGRGGVVKDIAGGKQYAGYPLMELKEWLRFNSKIFKHFDAKKA